MRHVIRLSLILTIICGVAAASLAGVYTTTRPLIEAQRYADLQAALRLAVPGADSFQRVEEDNRVHYLGMARGSPVGAATAVRSRGYGPVPMEMLVGIDNRGQVAGVLIISMSETPGLGTRVRQPAFLRQFLGRHVNDPIALGTDIDGITNATISVRAVVSGVREAADLLKADFLGQIQPRKVIDWTRIPDGDYEGTAAGFGGPIVVRVTVSQGRITRVVVVRHSESPGTSDPAIALMPARVVERQELDVDAVSNATITSRGILAAVEAALKDYIIVLEEGRR